jgi:NADH dehydrogenase
MSKKRVLIVGGGFAGIKVALELSKDKRLQISLLSNRSTFRFYPSLYTTVTGGLPEESSIPLNNILGDKPIRIIIGEAVQLDRKERTIITSRIDSYRYDILIMALGVVTNFKGIKGIEQYAFSIKSVEEVVRFKAHLHQQLIDEHKPDLHYVIVGGGPTGVELAGVLPGYIREIMGKHGIKHKAIHIDLVEAEPQLMLNIIKKETSDKITKRLHQLGVKLHVGKIVQGETANSLSFDGHPITTRSVVWTAGVTNHPFFKVNNFTINGNGKVAVDSHMQAEQNIYVLGDNADTPYSGMAQTGLHDAMYVSSYIFDQLDNKKTADYKPEKPVYIIPVGPHWAAVQWGNVQLYGWIGWLLRKTVSLQAFHYYEPWWRATEQWIKEFETVETCPVCASRM